MTKHAGLSVAIRSCAEDLGSQLLEWINHQSADLPGSRHIDAHGAKSSRTSRPSVLPLQRIVLAPFKIGNLRWVKVHRRTFKRSIRLSLVKLVYEDLEPLTAHLKLLDASL